MTTPEQVMSKREITPEAAIAFLEKAAVYFGKRPTHGEDAAHWSNVANAENCRKIATLLALLPPPSWRPIESADPNAVALLYAVPERLYTDPAGRPGAVVVARPNAYTWATHWLPIPPPPPAEGEG